MKQVNTIEDLIKYCFYTCDGKVSFGFNECWNIEEDINISSRLILKLRKMCPDLMEKSVFSTKNEMESKQ